MPYTSEGEGLISDLCAAYEPGNQFPILKRAQRFTVNVFPHILKKLQSAGAVHEVQEGAGILYLEKAYYSNEFGLSEEGAEEMEVLFG